MKKLTIMILAIACVMLLAVSASAAAPKPQKPDLGVDFGTVSTIDGFTPPSQLYVGTDERVLLTDGKGNYVTYPTYYVTKDNATFDFDFSKLNTAIVDTGITYTKKSVVLLEIPNGVTTISQSYFAGTGNFPLCIYVQFPGTVTSYGASLFAGYNSVIRAVEFLDGTEPITMGDSMFGSQWNGGATNIEYVKFPNNLVSLGNGTFGKATVSKTIILGENLESIGTGFLSESTPSNTDTFIYVSSKFFAETEMFKDLFGGRINGKDSTSLMLTIFYVGTETEARDFVTAGKAVQSGYVFDNVNFVSASEYDYETDRPKGTMHSTFVYDFGVCDAFYNGQHKDSAPTYNFTSVVEKSTITTSCTQCGKESSKTEIAPIFGGLMYSIKEDSNEFGLAMLYTVNKESKELYEKNTGKSLSYGVMAIAKKTITDENDVVSNPLNSDGTANCSNIVATAIEKDIGSVTLVIKGSGTAWNEAKDTEFYVTGYVTDGSNLQYFTTNASASLSSLATVTYSQYA